MTDNEWKETVCKITDPLEMLVCLVDNHELFGDPYYSDLKTTLLETARKIIHKNQLKGGEGNLM